MAANNSYQEAVSLIAAANRVVQDPSSVGAALRTISLRLRGTSTKELEEAGEDTTGVVESKSKLRTKIQGYTGIDILTDSGAYKSTYEILLEISKVWDDLTDQDRAGLLELIAGKTRSNAAAAILSNTKDLEEAYKTAMEAEGSALRENEKYLDSIQGKIDLFTNSIQTMWHNTLDSDIVKMAVELATNLVKIVDKLGLINTLVFGLMARMTVFKKNKVDLASILGIRDVDKGWTFGKEGVTGWFAKTFGKKKSLAEEVIGNPDDTKVSVQEFAESIKTNINDYVKVDTWDLDNQIEGINKKLEDARKRYQEFRTTDWDYYKALGSKAPAQDRQLRGQSIQAEINQLKTQSKKLEQQRAKIIDDAATKYAESIVGTPTQPKTSQYFDIFSNGLQGGSTKLVIDDLGQLSTELDKLNKMDNQGVVAYMQSLDDLGGISDNTKRILAGYASTVKDGKYTTQDAIKYTKQYNQGLKDMGREAQMAQLKQNLLNLAISLATMALTALITRLIELASESQNKFEELSSQLEATKSDIDSINSELDDTKNKIADLQKQGTLSFADQEELERLKALSAELERQKGLKESIQKQQQKGVNSASAKAAKEYYKAGKDSGKTTGEMAGEGAKYGLMVGGAAAGIVASSLAVGATNIWNPIGWAALVLAGVTAIGAGIGAAIGAAEEKVGESMDNMRENYEKLQSEYEAAQQKYATDTTDTNYDKMQKAQEKLIEYESMMANNLAEMDAYYSQIDLSVYDPVKDAEEIKRLRAEMNNFYDTQDKWLIQSKTASAKENAISRIFGENADDQLKEIKTQIKAALDAGEDVDIKSMFGNTEDYDAFVARLHDMGIYLFEVENYFKDVVEAESEFVDNDLEDVAKDISKITDGLDSLKSAFDEVIDKGILTAKTILDIKEALGIGVDDTEELTSAWKDYLEVMMSGTATTEEMVEATEKLTQAWIEDAIANNSLTPETKMEYIAQLRSIGVENAEEYVDDLLKKNMTKEIEGKIKSDPTLFDDEAIAEMAKAYGVEEDAIRGIVDQLKKKHELEQQIIETQKEQSAYNDWLNGDGGINALSEELNGFDPNNYKKQKTGTSWGMVWDSGAQAYVMQVTSTYNYVDANGNTLTETEYYNLLSLKQKYDDLWKEGEEKGYIIDGKIVDPNFQAEIDNLQTEIDDVTTEIDKELSIDVQLQLNLQNKSELVDDIQNVFDDLKNAVTEYNENGGKISVDTLQTLLSLEPKYLGLLYTEEGQLKLNQQAIFDVAKARILDMGIQKAQNAIDAVETALNEDKIEKAYELTTANYGLAESTWAVVDARMADVATLMQQKGMSQDSIDAFINSINAIKTTTESAISDLPNLLSTSGNTVTKETEDAFQKAMDYWDNRIEANQAKYDQIQNDIDWLESQGKMADANYYKDQINLLTQGEESKTALLNNKLKQAAARMRELEAAGKEGSDEWWEAAEIYNSTLSELDDVRDTVIELQDAIGEVEWSKFEEFNTRLDDINSKLETMRDLIAPDGEEDWFDDEGNWTEKGVAVLGSYVQSLEYYKNGLAEANDALTEFNSIGNGAEWSQLSDAQRKDYADTYGIHSEQEYYDYLKKLTDEQYKNATAVSDTKQEIVDMYESSIDAVEEYINTLVEGYQDYIDVVKESLDAERDLYDFKRKIEDQSTDIAATERKIVALSGSTNAADIAERRRLEKTLYDQKRDLEDSYRDHSMDSQQNALDKEAQAYEESMNKFVENLRTNLDLALEDMGSFMAGVTAAVTANAPLILDEYGKLGVALDEAIVSPWQAAEDAMDGYTKEKGLGLMNSWVASGGVFDTFANNATTYLTSIWDETNVDPDNAFADAVNGVVEGIVQSIQSNVITARGYLTDLINIADTATKYTGGGNGGVPPGGNSLNVLSKETKVDMIPHYLDSAGNIYYKVQGMTDAYVSKASTTNKSGILYAPKGSLYYGLAEKNLKKKQYGGNTSAGGGGKLSYVSMYAKGTTGTTEDQWAITDEPWLGDELTMYATPDGKLSYMRAGSTVIPADITSNLVEWGKLNPDMMKIGGGANINMISNAVNKPELNFEFDSLVHVDHCDEGTLKDLEKMVDNKINQFTKRLNYSLKGIGAK